MRHLRQLLPGVLLLPFAVLVIAATSRSASGDGTVLGYALLSSLRSLVYALTVALLASGLGAGLAYVLGSVRLPGKTVLQKLVVLPLLLPPFVVGLIYRELGSSSGPVADLLGFSLGLDVASGWGFVWCGVITLYPWTYLLFRVTFESHGGAMIEVGRVTGLGPWRIARTILLPLSLPALLLGGGLVLLEVFSELATAVVLRVTTGSTILHNLWLTLERPHLAAQISLFFLLLVIAVVLVALRRLGPERFRYLVLPATARAPAATSVSTGWAVLLIVLALLPAVLGFFLPASVGVALFVQTMAIVDLSSLLGDCASSLALVVAVTVLCLAVTSALAWLNHVAPHPIGRFVIRFLCASYLLPAITVALVVLWSVELGLPFIERFSDLTAFILLVAALGLRFICLLLVPTQAGLGFLPRRLGEVTSMLGLSPNRAFWTVHLPHARRYLLLGVMLVVLQVLKESTITLVMRPFAFEPVVLRAYSLIQLDLLPASAGWVLALVLLGIYPLMMIEGLLVSRRLTGG